MDFQKTTLAGFAILILAGIAAFDLYARIQADGEIPISSSAAARPGSTSGDQRGAISKRRNSAQMGNHSQQDDPRCVYPGNSAALISSVPISPSPSLNQSASNDAMAVNALSQPPVNLNSASSSKPGSLSRRPLSADVDGSTPVEGAVPATLEQSPRLPLAAALSDSLTDQELNALGAHAKAAILELGAFREDSSGSDVLAVPAIGCAWRHCPPGSESDACLYATLGQDRYNQLSFLAAWKRHESEIAAASTR